MLAFCCSWLILIFGYLKANIWLCCSCKYLLSHKPLFRDRQTDRQTDVTAVRSAFLTGSRAMQQHILYMPFLAAGRTTPPLASGSLFFTSFRIAVNCCCKNFCPSALPGVRLLLRKTALSQCFASLPIVPGISNFQKQTSVPLPTSPTRLS